VQLTFKPSAEDHRVAKLAALAIGIHVLESMLPSFLPGVKPGLANIITLVVFLLYGFELAAWVSLLRVLVGSLVLGTFLSPTFALSLSGAIASVLILWLVSKVPKLGIGAVGLAILMAMAHMSAQFFVVYGFFIPHEAIFDVLPVLMTAALVFGLLNGVLSQKVYIKLTRKLC